MSELTPDRKKDLCEHTGKMMVYQQSHVDSMMRYKKGLKFFNERFLDNKNKNIETMDVLLGFAVHISYLYLELGTATRQYLKSEIHYEERFAVKQMNVIMLEGHKRIYGYGGIIKESIWLKVKPISEQLSETTQAQYNEITEKIITMGISGVFDKDSRDLAVHFDTDVEKVYDMLLSLNAESFFINVISFLDLLLCISKFLSETLNEFGKILNSSVVVHSSQMNKVKDVLTIAKATHGDNPQLLEIEKMMEKIDSLIKFNKPTL